MKTVLITGGAGFIGSALVRLMLRDSDWRVVNVDKLTYAGNLESLVDVSDSPNYRFEHADIADTVAMRRIVETYRPSAIMHLAAESHVDRSIDGPQAFIETNVVGTFTLLQEALRYWRSLTAAERAAFRFLHVSTDEVFGSLGATGYFTETTAYSPNSPYSASKAASDHLVRAWHHTYELPALTTHCSNNYGPYQFPEKLIPLMIQNALVGQPLPVYGTGDNVRDWLYVDDHAAALKRVLQAGEPGETYAIGGGNERSNLDVVNHICDLVSRLAPSTTLGDRRSLITFVQDRPGHDKRYAIDASKLRRALAWEPAQTFETGLERTVAWYLANQTWCERVKSGAYRGERLGLGVGHADSLPVSASIAPSRPLRSA